MIVRIAVYVATVIKMELVGAMRFTGGEDVTMKPQVHQQVWPHSAAFRTLAEWCGKFSRVGWATRFSNSLTAQPSFKMPIAPITGKLRKRLWLDLSVAFGLGISSAYAFWYVSLRDLWFTLILTDRYGYHLKKGKQRSRRHYGSETC